MNPTTGNPAAAASDGVAFKAQLDGSVAALFAGAKSDAVTTTAAPAPVIPSSSKDVDAKLAQAVKDLLDRGTALGDVIARLASSLATSVAAQLGISPQAALEKLTQAFTQVLQSNGTGPPGTNAERASSLVSRLRQIAELATGVTNGDSGQSIRTIAGTSLDANSAKANPPPTPDSILRSALDALAAPASPVPDPALVAAAAPATSPAAQAAGDGRTVALPAVVQAVASGGDTLLGRILTRAMLADPQPSAPADATPVDAAANRIANAAPAPAAAAHPASANVNPNAANANVLEAFVHAFTSAVARNDAAQRSEPAAILPFDAPAPPAPAPPPQTPLTFAIPVAHDSLPVAPAPPAPAAAQPPHVDANAVVDQMLRGMAIRTTDGQSEVRLRLVPENLGDVSVKLIVSGGSVDASIVAHTADAQTALAGGQLQLAKTLADAGLKLQSFTVGLAGDFTGNRDQSRPNDSWNRSGWRRIGVVESVGTDESADPALLAVPSFGPPIYAASPALRNLNYLV
ncbi:MAG TPA: flagellar hook-length control protein FliK [Candidatus Elarobacter sp.]|nr:flagellar hook-length control protein FliK [Candidatus Elarobacter sp.]